MIRQDETPQVSITTKAIQSKETNVRDQQGIIVLPDDPVFRKLLLLHFRRCL